MDGYDTTLTQSVTTGAWGRDGRRYISGVPASSEVAFSLRWSGRNRPLSWPGYAISPEQRSELNNPTSMPMSDNVGIVADQGFNHVDISASDAFDHDDPSDRMDLEMIRAVFGKTRPLYDTNEFRQQLSELTSSSLVGGASEPEITDTLSEFDGVPLGPYLSRGEDGLENIVHQLRLEPVFGRSSNIFDREHDDGSDSGFWQCSHSSMRDENDFRTTSPGIYGVSSMHSVSVGSEYDSANDFDFPHVTDIDFDDFYREFEYESVSQISDAVFPVHDGFDDNGQNHLPIGENIHAEDEESDMHMSTSSSHGTTHESNLTVDEFIRHWLRRPESLHLSSCGLPIRQPSVSRPFGCIFDWDPPTRITRPLGYKHDFYDLQQIPWWDTLRVRREDARALRDAWYTPYHNLDYFPHTYAKRLPATESYFREKAMYTKQKASIEHFQLRNLMSVASYDTLHFAYQCKLYSWTPGYDDLTCLIDLSAPGPESSFLNPVKISTMCSRYGLSIAGGFNGEYAMRVAGITGSGGEGFATKNFNGITNHIDIILHRTNRSPIAVIASNDKHLRILDCETNRFVADRSLSRAINCSATSDDGRLRVIVGDSPDAWVIEADSGEPVHPLRGHRDFGFACAWSPDMRHIATSNQDKTVMIWDTRTWRVLETIESDVAGYRSLRYSPVGGGSRTLLMCEPADRISIVNAQTYQTRQVYDFFGEIGGAEYTPDGSSIWVANTDNHFGGFMEFDRRYWGQLYGSSDLPNDWLPEEDLDSDERCVLSARERQLRCWHGLNDNEHDAFL